MSLDRIAPPFSGLTMEHAHAVPPHAEAMHVAPARNDAPAQPVVAPATPPSAEALSRIAELVASMVSQGRF
jgi:hypothetical protein